MLNCTMGTETSKYCIAIYGEVYTQVCYAASSWYRTFKNVPQYNHCAFVLCHTVILKNFDSSTEQIIYQCAQHHQQCLLYLLCNTVLPHSVTKMQWWKTTRMIYMHGAVKEWHIQSVENCQNGTCIPLLGIVGYMEKCDVT